MSDAVTIRETGGYLLWKGPMPVTVSRSFPCEAVNICLYTFTRGLSLN